MSIDVHQPSESTDTLSHRMTLEQLPSHLHHALFPLEFLSMKQTAWEMATSKLLKSKALMEKAGM